MKRIVLLLVFLATSSLAQAQLANTKWTGNLAVPEISPVYLHFKPDVFEVYLQESNELIETMSYKLSGDTITLKKISGGSPCPDASEFKLKYAMQGEQMLITLVSDDCPERAGAWTKEPFTKVKE